MKTSLSPPASFQDITTGLRRSRPLGLFHKFKYVAGAICGFATVLSPSANLQPSPNLADLSIEQLMDESVTSVSKKETKLGDAPAAISVVTQDDIRRLGITTIPEALRLVPGLDVARINANEWAISSRGFNGQFANKLLVLIDGRTVYDPNFSGVFWGVQDTDMEDIDRIEVIRGPGAALWGANAVNGVINIVTKSAKETQGTRVTTAFGTEEQPSTTARYGGQIGSNLFYRAYVKYFDRASFSDSAHHDAQDGWNATRGGFRVDWEPPTENTLTLQGDYYYTETSGRHDFAQLDAPYSKTLRVRDYDNGGNLLGRFSHRFSSTSELTIQSYFDHTVHMFEGLKDKTDTFDIDAQHRFSLGDRNALLWGLGYRHLVSRIPFTPTLSVPDERRAYNLYTGFIQDQLTILPERLQFILGSKLEHNDVTGFEVQPSARILWTPTSKQTAWLAVSRSVRTPSRGDDEIRFALNVSRPSPYAPPVEILNQGNPNLRAEKEWSYELGYRVEPTKQLSLDVTAFYNVYNDLVGTVPLPPAFAGDHIEVPLLNTNNQHGETYGSEVSLQWKVTDHWRLGADYSWLRMHTRPDATIEGNSPQNQAHLRSYLDLPYHLELNGSLSYVDRLHTSPPVHQIPAYVRLDLGVTWHPTKNVEIGVWGQNLLDSHHPEFINYTSGQVTEIPRSVLLKVTLSF